MFHLFITHKINMINEGDAIRMRNACDGIEKSGHHVQAVITW
jgi:hypothetical protein